MSKACWRSLATILIIFGAFCCVSCKDIEHTHGDGNNQELKMLPLETVTADTQYRHWLKGLPEYSQRYDAARNPENDLASAMRTADDSNKLVFMVVGGNWCSWCHVMTRFFSQQAVLQQLLLDNYEILKINMSETNSNVEFLAGYPEIHGYPHIFILSSTGQLVHSQDTFKLQQGDGYSRAKFEHFLRQYAVEK